MSLSQLGIAPSEIVEHQNKRWQEIVESGHPGIDTDIIDILDTINNFPGVATVFSCSGHYVPDRSKRKTQFYIRLIATEVGLKYISELYQCLINEAKSQRDSRQLLEEKVVRDMTMRKYDKLALSHQLIRLTITEQGLSDDVCVPGIIFSMGQLFHQEELDLAYDTVRLCLDIVNRPRGQQLLRMLDE